MYYRYLGLDACKGGWVAAIIAQDRACTLEKVATLADLDWQHHSYRRILIDIPIGLPDNPSQERPETAARKLLKGKASSLFNTPCRQAVYADDYAEANRLNRSVLGKGLSKQSFYICSKIREVDQFLKDHPELKDSIRESHPELCFAMLNGGVPVMAYKKTTLGVEKRREILSRFYPQAGRLIAKAQGEGRWSKVLDDVIDALCLAVVGLVSEEAGLEGIPRQPQRDSEGLPMQILYTKPSEQHFFRKIPK